MLYKINNKRKFDGLERELAEKQQASMGKRTIAGPTSETSTGLGQGIGSVRKILNDDGSSKRDGRSKERQFHEDTGRVKKCK